MSSVQVPLVLAAALLLLAAHALRALRWSLLFPRSRSEPDQRGLLVSLGVGYALNAIIPFRLGEVVRAVVASRLRSARLAEVLATVVAERLCDVAIVTIFIVGAAVGAGSTAYALTAIAYLGLFAAFAIVAAGLRYSATLRALLWKAIAVFNPRIRLALADFAWSTSEILVGGTLLRWQFTVTTGAMWATYFAAYAAFAAAIGISQGAVVDALLLHPFSSFVDGAVTSAIPAPALAIFVLAPVVAILLGASLAQRAGLSPGANELRLKSPKPHFSSRARYTSISGYDDFLDAMFSNTRSVVSGFGLRAVSDCVVHNFYRGGSEALTALVETQDRLLIRKFAMGSAALKLKQQADWLQRHGGCDVPLVPILNQKSSAGAFQYDMPMLERTAPFYEAIHSAPLTDSSRTMLGLLDRVDRLHGVGAIGTADARQIDQYFERKVSANAGNITQFARHVLHDEEYSINGVAYRIDEWSVFGNEEWVGRQMCNRSQASIHGDLTIENVVIAPDHEQGYYLIDPNPENAFDSPFIDWAKMMQSLHLGYEMLNRTARVSPAGRDIALPIARSEAYASLHKMLEGEIVSRFSADGLREVYFHELVNYLRLTPYKMRQSRDRGLAFFACTSMLLRKYRHAYG